MNNDWPRIKDYGASGIYMVINLITYKYYIGKANAFINRKNDHLIKNVKRIGTSNVGLQNDISKYGVKNFRFIILENVPIDELEKREKEYLFELDWSLSDSRKYFYNIGYKNHYSVNGLVLYQYDENGKYITNYSSAKHAAESLGIKYQNIKSYIKRKKITKDGYIFSRHKLRKKDIKFFKKIKNLKTKDCETNTN